MSLRVQFVFTEIRVSGVALSESLHHKTGVLHYGDLAVVLFTVKTNCPHMDIN